MLDKARKRQIYDHLVCADVTEFLETHANNFDVAVAGDVFIYIGELSKVFCGVARALRRGGVFAFSVEAGEGEDFVLRDTLRYAHSVAYLRKLAADNNFTVEKMEPRVIRQEHGMDVNGYLVVMRSQ